MSERTITVVALQANPMVVSRRIRHIKPSHILFPSLA